MYTIWYNVYTIFFERGAHHMMNHEKSEFHDFPAFIAAFFLVFIVIFPLAVGSVVGDEQTPESMQTPETAQTYESAMVLSDEQTAETAQPQASDLVLSDEQSAESIQSQESNTIFSDKQTPEPTETISIPDYIELGYVNGDFYSDLTLYDESYTHMKNSLYLPNGMLVTFIDDRRNDDSLKVEDVTITCINDDSVVMAESFDTSDNEEVSFSVDNLKKDVVYKIKLTLKAVDTGEKIIYVRNFSIAF